MLVYSLEKWENSSSNAGLFIRSVLFPASCVAEHLREEVARLIDHGQHQDWVLRGILHRKEKEACAWLAWLRDVLIWLRSSTGRWSCGRSYATATGGLGSSTSTAGMWPGLCCYHLFRHWACHPPCWTLLQGNLMSNWQLSSNHDNNIRTMFMMLSSWLTVNVRVHPVYMMNTKQCQMTADLWTKPTDLSYNKTVCRLQGNYTHHCHLLLRSPKADTHTTIPRRVEVGRVEGWVDLDSWLHTQMVYLPTK